MKVEASNYPAGEGQTRFSPGPLGGSDEDPKPFVLVVRREDPPGEDDVRETVYELYTGRCQSDDNEARAQWLEEVVDTLEVEIGRLRTPPPTEDPEG